MASSKVQAKEAVVINVGGRPIQYGRITVRHNKTGELVEIDNQNDIADPGDEGVPYAFKEGQVVAKDHPAVKAAPGAFVPADESAAAAA